MEAGKRDIGERGWKVTLQSRVHLAHQAHSEFLFGLMQGHSHFLTITYRGVEVDSNSRNGRKKFEATVAHFLHRVDRKTFGRRSKRADGWVPRVIVIESASAKSGRVHAHITLGAPEGFSHQEFNQVLRGAVKRCEMLGRQYWLEEITDPRGLAHYFAKEGPDALVLEQPRL